MALLNNVKNYLNSRHITVPNEWIEPCLEFISEDNPGLNMNNTKMVLEKVYEQWLHCDLTELASSCLPFGLAEKKSVTLSGNFVVQVNQLRDVGHPAYSQLQKLRKADNENASVSAERSYQSSWDPKPNRMLLMQMTDGTSLVQGMEYQPLPQVDINIKPGTKVLLSGTIEARKGVLLLTREHVKLLGGETESLLITNALENVLARTLGAEETEEPRVLEQAPPTQIPPSQASQYYPSQLNASQPRSQNVSQVSRGRGGRVPTVTRQPNITTTTLSATDDLGDDDFLDPDFEAALNQIESQAVTSTASRNSGNSSGFGSSKSHTHNSRLPINDSIKSSHSRTVKNNTWQDPELEMEFSDDFLNDDFGDELLLSAEGLINQSPMPPPTLPVQSVGPLSAPNKSLSKKHMNKDNTLKQRPFNDRNNFSPFNSTPSMAAASQKVNNVSDSYASSSSKSAKVYTNQSRLTSFIKKDGNSQVDNQSRLTSFIMKDGNSQVDNKRSFKSPAKDSPISATFDVMDDDFMDCLEVDDYDRQAKRTKISMETDTLTQRVKGKPYTYLFLLPEMPTASQEFLVKGFIMTLVSKLEISNGKWKLTVIVNDGSASREVDIDDKILRQFIGMNVVEFQQKKKECRSNPGLQMQLSKCVSGCQQKLISLCSLLKIVVSGDNPRPRLTELIPITSPVAVQLSQRISNL